MVVVFCLLLVRNGLLISGWLLVYVSVRCLLLSCVVCCCLLSLYCLCCLPCVACYVMLSVVVRC